jgi:hypothetical protein
MAAQINPSIRSRMNIQIIHASKIAS